MVAHSAHWGERSAQASLRALRSRQNRDLCQYLPTEIPNTGTAVAHLRPPQSRWAYPSPALRALLRDNRIIASSLPAMPVVERRRCAVGASHGRGPVGDQELAIHQLFMRDTSDRRTPVYSPSATMCLMSIWVVEAKRRPAHGP